MSQYFNNDIPSFNFTLQKVSGNNKIGGGKNSDYVHFKVTERKLNKKVDFRLKNLKLQKILNQ